MSDVTTPVVTPAAPVTGAASPVVPETAVPAPAPEAKDLQLAQRIAALTKKEASALRARQEATTAAQALAAREAALAEREAKLQRFESLKGTNDFAALAELGLDYDRITQIKMNGGKVPAELQIQQLRDEMAAKERTAAEQKAAEAAAAEAAQQASIELAVTEFKKQIDAHLATSKDYPFLAARGDPSLVYDIIDDNYKRTGKILEIPEAAKLYDTWLRNDAMAAQKLLTPEPEVKPALPATKQVPQWNVQKPASTLTNGMAPVTSSAKPTKITSREDDIKRIMSRAKLGT